MSRIGKMPVPVPGTATLTITGGVVSVKGPRGELSRTLPEGVSVALADGQLTVSRRSDQPRDKAMHGLTRTLIANMVEGVTNGFEKVLEIQGVGYKAETTRTGVTLLVGLSHPVHYPAPPGITIQVENNTVVKIAGPSKELVGQVAAELRSVRPPEPYKGKGVRYRGEQVRRKAGKTGAK